MLDEESPEDVYYETLGDILQCVTPPVTVGLYGPCRKRLSWYMDNIALHIKKNEESSSCQCGIRCLVQFYHKMILLWKIAMCMPPPRDPKSKPLHIFVPFQAWEFVGNDFLWAGLVTTLCGCIEEKYYLPLIFYKLFGIPVHDDTESCGEITKRYLKRLLFFSSLLLVILIILYSFIFDLDISDTMNTLLFTGAPASIMTTWSLGHGIYAYYWNSVEIINKLMNNTKFSNQLGFMHCVKEKVEDLTKFLRVLGSYKKRQVRVVLQISHLDACPAEKVMGALEALRILHSDPKAPFISILAADSKVLAESVERSSRVGSLPGSGYQYLNEFITLPISEPRINTKAKQNLLDNIRPSEKTEKLGTKRKWQPGKHNNNLEDGRKNNGDLNIGVVNGQLETIITYLREDNIAKFLPNNQTHMERVVYASWITLELRKQKFKALGCVQQQTISTEAEEGEQKQQLQEIDCDLKDHGKKWDQNKKFYSKVIAWVLLANEWPCRVSWLLQCAKDEKQWKKICEGRLTDNDPEHSGTKQQLIEGTQRDHKKDNTSRPCHPEAQDYIKERDSLVKAFDKAIPELASVKEEMKKLLELDRDLETFLQMLNYLDKIGFTVKQALEYWDITTNLDGSLKRSMELIRGSQTLKQAVKCHQFLPLPLLKMSTEEVCQALEQNASKWGISETNMKQYIKKIEKENLSGQALVYSLNSEIRKALDMTLGEWARFSISFLNVLRGSNPPELPATLRE